MKKLLRFLPMLLMGVLAVSMAACSDDDNPVNENELPATAQSFLAKYYPQTNVLTLVKDGKEYEAILTNGHEVDFDKEGEWKTVEAPVGAKIPSGFYPEAIDIYVAEHYNNVGINEISRDRNGYDVELLTGVDIHFGSAGEFISADRH